MFFFFKQKTAYEMRISDWSSDVCSSDLIDGAIGDLEIRDVALALADDGRQAAQAARRIGDHQMQPPDMDVGILGCLLPGHVEPALGRIGEALQSLAVDGMDGDALAGGHDSDRKSTRLNSSH